MRWLPLVLLLASARPAHGQAIGMYVGTFFGGPSLTKLGENDYQMSFEWYWDDYSFPTSGVHPTLGYPIGYGLY